MSLRLATQNENRCRSDFGPLTSDLGLLFSKEVKPTMFYIGLDIHGKWSNAGGFNPASGEIVEFDRVSNEPGEMAKALSELEGPLYGVMEAGTDAWAMYREFLPLFERLVVVDPASLWDRKSDRQAKTDRKTQ